MTSSTVVERARRVRKTPRLPELLGQPPAVGVTLEDVRRGVRYPVGGGAARRPGRDRAPESMDHATVADHEHRLAPELIGDVIEDLEHPFRGLPPVLATRNPGRQVTGEPRAE